MILVKSKNKECSADGDVMICRMSRLNRRKQAKSKGIVTVRRKPEVLCRNEGWLPRNTSTPCCTLNDEKRNVRR